MTPNQDDIPDHDLSLDVDSAADAPFIDSITLGRPSTPEGQPDARRTTIGIEDVPDCLSPAVDWYYGRPVLHLYDVQTEEPAYMIALHTEENPNAEVVGRRGEFDEEWLDEHRPDHDRTRTTNRSGTPLSPGFTFNSGG